MDGSTTPVDEQILGSMVQCTDEIVKAYQRKIGVPPYFALVSGSFFDKIRTQAVNHLTPLVQALTYCAGSLGAEISAPYIEGQTKRKMIRSIPVVSQNLKNTFRDAVHHVMFPHFETVVLAAYYLPFKWTFDFYPESVHLLAPIIEEIREKLIASGFHDVHLFPSTNAIDISRAEKKGTAKFLINTVLKRLRKEGLKIKYHQFFKGVLSAGDSPNDVPMLNFVAEKGVALWLGGPRPADLNDKVVSLPAEFLNEKGLEAFLREHLRWLENPGARLGKAEEIRLGDLYRVKSDELFAFIQDYPRIAVEIGMRAGGDGFVLFPKSFDKANAYLREAHGEKAFRFVWVDGRIPDLDYVDYLARGEIPIAVPTPLSHDLDAHFSGFLLSPDEAFFIIREYLDLIQNLKEYGENTFISLLIKSTVRTLLYNVEFFTASPDMFEFLAVSAKAYLCELLDSHFSSDMDVALQATRDSAGTTFVDSQRARRLSKKRLGRLHYLPADEFLFFDELEPLLLNFHYLMDTNPTMSYHEGYTGGLYETPWQTPNAGKTAASGRPLVET
ncbi:MAG: hypothetical protein HYZ52_07365, partial [Candidatus Omnitrophica bacterium]|nr:hypothetical protein [Candidatus Omnitrophota bacterium]